MKPFFSVGALLVAVVVAAPVSAKLPPPSDEAKAKAAEAAAKAAHGNKVGAYQLCRSQDRVAAEFFAAARKAGTAVSPALPTPPCVDPGPFVAAPAQAVAALPAAAVAAAPSASQATK